MIHQDGTLGTERSHRRVEVEHGLSGRRLAPDEVLEPVIDEEYQLLRRLTDYREPYRYEETYSPFRVVPISSVQSAVLTPSGFDSPPSLAYHPRAQICTKL